MPTKGFSGLNFLKSDLKLAIDSVKTEPGSLVIVRPKDRFTTFTAEYCGWLSENLGSMLPPGVKAMILTDDSTEIRALDVEWPAQASSFQAGEADAYEMGWMAAFAALERACS